jgi:hypothetical protein
MLVSNAHAQPAPPPPPPIPSSAPSVGSGISAARLWLGPQLDIMPSGSLNGEANGSSASFDTSSAFGLGGLVELRVARLVTLGVAPRLILPVKVSGATDSGTEIDLRARATVGNQVGPRSRLHGIATAGYSWMVNVLALTDANGNLIRYQTTSGLVIGFGMGGSYAINPRLLFVGEVSYQLGYQGTTVTEPPVMDLEVKAGSNYLTLGFGFLAAFGG